MARFAVVKLWNGMPDPQVIDYAATWEEAEEKAKRIPKGGGYSVQIWNFVDGGVA
jgi:hypothetical protein